MIEVTCAIIRNDEDEILVVQRSEKSDNPLKWEFPGGKLNEDEDSEDCILREIKEELGMDIIIWEKMTEVEYDYGYKQVKLIPFICETLIDEPVLTEHKDYRWVKTGSFKEIDFSEADIPVANEYAEKYPSEQFSVSEDVQAADVDKEKIRDMLTGSGGINACSLIAESVIENLNVINCLIEFSLLSDKTLSFRASYSIVKASEKEPGIIIPYTSRFIRSLPELSNESVIRSFLKMVLEADFNDIPHAEQGLLADFCFRMLNTASSAIAIKAYSMEAIYNLSLIYPDLRVELINTITRIIDDSSAGVKAKGADILERLRKVIKKDN